MLREVVSFVIIPEETIIGRWGWPVENEYEFPEFYSYPKMPFKFEFSVSELQLRFLSCHKKRVGLRDYFTSPKEKIKKGNYHFVLLSPSREQKNKECFNFR